MTLRGIDVSNWQGDSFPWPSYRGKIDFAGVRVCEGLGPVDRDAARNIAGAHALGIPVIGYHFLHASLSGPAQAEHYLSLAHAAGLRPGDLMAEDAEDGGLDGLSPARMDVAAAGFAAQVRKHKPGYNPVVYTEISMAPFLVSMGACPPWLANPSGTKVTSVGPWKAISFEQTSQDPLDLDVFYGDKAALAKLAFK